MQLPNDIFHSNFGRNIFTRTGGIPPIHFMKHTPKKTTGENLDTDEMLFSKPVTKKFEFFPTGNLKEAIQFIMILFDSMLSGLKVPARVDIVHTFLQSRKASLDHLTRRNSNIFYFSKKKIK
jgi:hypothetical protein